MSNTAASLHAERVKAIPEVISDRQHVLWKFVDFLVQKCTSTDEVFYTAVLECYAWAKHAALVGDTAIQRPLETILEYFGIDETTLYCYKDAGIKSVGEWGNKTKVLVFHDITSEFFMVPTAVTGDYYFTCPDKKYYDSWLFAARSNTNVWPNQTFARMLPKKITGRFFISREEYLKCNAIAGNNTDEFITDNFPRKIVGHAFLAETPIDTIPAHVTLHNLEIAYSDRLKLPARIHGDLIISAFDSYNEVSELYDLPDVKGTIFLQNCTPGEKVKFKCNTIICKIDSEYAPIPLDNLLRNARNVSILCSRGCTLESVGTLDYKGTVTETTSDLYIENYYMPNLAGLTINGNFTLKVPTFAHRKLPAKVTGNLCLSHHEKWFSSENPTEESIRKCCDVGGKVVLQDSSAEVAYQRR